MSSVRMCDKCGSIFSELTEDWSTMAGSKFHTNPVTGKRERVDVEMDVCGQCNAMTAPKLIPQIQIDGVPTVVQ